MLGLASLTFVQADELCFGARAHAFAISDALDSVLWLQAVQKLINAGLFRVFVQQIRVVLVDVIDVHVSHCRYIGGRLRLVTLSDFEQRLDSELLAQDANGGLRDFLLLELLLLLQVLTPLMRLVARVGHDDEDYHEDESDNGFPDLHVARRDDNKHEEEPDVRPGRE